MPPKRKASTPKRTPKRGRKGASQDIHYPGGGLATSFQGLLSLITECKC